MHLLKIASVACDVVQFYHSRHNHEHAVHPPQVLVVASCYLIAHDPECALYLSLVGAVVVVVKVGIYLKAYLIVAKEHVLASLAVGG